MKYKLTNEQKEMIKHIEDTIFSKYEIDMQDYIEIETLFTILEDLMGKIGYLKDKIEDIKDELNNDYD